jgi:Cu-Zn family superoxide dismutase
MKPITLVLGLALATLSTAAVAETVKAELSLVSAEGVGAPVGVLTLTDTPAGAKIAYDLHGLPPGAHGLHVHANGSCQPGPNVEGKLIPAGAAGGHFDPAGTKMHMGPMGGGHAGDLPFITLDASGAAKGETVAPGIKSVAAFSGHAIMLHAGGDNYADTPAPLGGGGARLACGVGK